MLFIYYNHIYVILILNFHFIQSLVCSVMQMVFCISKTNYTSLEYCTAEFRLAQFLSQVIQLMVY
jgi:hypothetical protein